MKKKYYTLLLVPVALMILFFARMSPKLAEEVFSLRIYKVLSVFISSITSWVSFSIAELMIIALPCILLGAIIRFILRMVKRKGKRKDTAVRFVLNLSCVLSVAFFLFVLLCGVNYYRYPFTYYSGLTIEESTKEELYDLCVELANKANELRAQITREDTAGVMESVRTKSGLAKASEEAMESLYEEYPVLSGYRAIPKGILLSKLMSYTETTGIYIPFTVEANVNTDVLDYTIPATMCHELSHLRGFMREDEANYIAFLACTTYDDIEFQYSGVMLALAYAENQLYKVDRSSYATLIESYSEGIKRDLIADWEYWRQYEGTVVSTVSNQMNNAYLKANNQKDGTRSYGRMVDLLLAKRRSKNSLF